ncbi:MAG: hypothetical protein J0J01_03000 [Reyranella sp.]|uniref:hypothetical protein n=1 Tax=Reyranella sp. TaxID=1929291 RepID=UPI001AC2F511|nr:hypothetical protein [Reyranella sp.]MBN9085853.1 hypothetical protein [Reyranella sp.]
MKSKASSYVVNGRLSDVLALIQVLALDKHAHRSAEGLARGLQGPPGSASSWSDVAEKHPEFFRLSSGTNRVSLVARHVTPREADDSRKPLDADYTATLLELAVELHDREVKRAERWQVWMPLAVAITAGVFTVFGVLLKSVLDVN